ncbi:dienelactone hydrolase family protein [Actinokineospora sp. NPDC004072]
MRIVVFHHAQGLTDGVRAFAGRLAALGHAVTTPDLFDGRAFATLDEGVAHAESIGMLAVAERGAAVADPDAAVFVGFSLGVLPAQKLAQTRPGARAAVLVHGAIPLDVFGPWQPGVALQLHIAESDPWGDLPVARDLVDAVPGAELFVYPGSTHLTTDSGLDGYDEAATEQIVRRIGALLA